MYALVPPQNEQHWEAIRTLYERAFPASEKKPFPLMLQKEKEGSMEFLAILSESGDFCGFIINILHADLLLLDYFAIAEEKRGCGIGSQGLALLRQRYPHRRLLLEIEDPNEMGAANLQERIRRRDFYRRNGWNPMPYTVSLFGVPMQVLCPGETVDFPEYHQIFVQVFSEKTAQKVFRLS